MAQRTVALCDGKYIGIESIYTVVNGCQINIPDKLKELRISTKAIGFILIRIIRFLRKSRGLQE